MLCFCCITDEQQDKSHIHVCYSKCSMHSLCISVSPSPCDLKLKLVVCSSAHAWMNKFHISTKATLALACCILEGLPETVSEKVMIGGEGVSRTKSSFFFFLVFPMLELVLCQTRCRHLGCPTTFVHGGQLRNSHQGF